MNESGNVKQYYDYDPFGKTLRESIAGTEKAKYRFTGKELDEEPVYTDRGLDWYYFGARYYDPNIGRFLTRDPMAEQYPSLSPYVYAANNPLIFLDPTGMVLEYGGDSSAVMSDLRWISGLGSEEFNKRLSVSGSQIDFNFNDLDLKSNEVLKLLQQVITSKNTYNLTFRDAIQGEKGLYGTMDELGAAVLSHTPRLASNVAGELPPGSGGQVTIATNANWYQRIGGSDLMIIRPNVTFHELAECYSRTDLGKYYMSSETTGAHFDAIQREMKWVGQLRTVVPIPTSPAIIQNIIVKFPWSR